MSVIKRHLYYPPRSVDAPIWVIAKMGPGACCLLICIYRLLIHGLCITMIKECVNYLTYQTTNSWHSVDNHFHALSSQSPLSSVTVCIIIWTYWLPCCLSKTRPLCKAEPSNLLARVGLILLVFMYPAKWYILPGPLLFINQYSYATAHYYSIMILYVTFSVKQHIEPGKNTLTHSDLHFLVSHIPPCFHCIASHQQHFKLYVWPPCWLNQAGNIWHSTHIPVVWAFRILDAIVFLSLDSSTASQSSSLSFGLAKSPFQLSQFSVSEMLSGALSSSHSAARWSILLIGWTFNTWVHPPGQSIADTTGCKGDLADNI